MTDKPAKRGRGRPSYEPNDEHREKIRILASVGVAHEIIAKVIGISRPTMDLYYAEELETSAILANANVAANLYKQATKDDPKAVQAAIAWLKMRAGWSDYSPPPALAAHLEPKSEKLGKKETANLMARNPDRGTAIGALMAKRQQTLPN